MIASEEDLVGSGRHRQCRECRYETNQRWREWGRDAAIARRDLESERYSREWHDWVRGKRQTQPAPARW